MTGPSPHLSWKELACKDGTPYPQGFIDDGRCAQLAETFEAIRAGCGDQPMPVLSAYRTKAHNRKVGGVRTSQHLYGRALDIRHPELSPDDLFTKIRLMHKAGQLPRLGGIGSYRGFVHIDIRVPKVPGYLAVWYGSTETHRPAA